MEGRLDPALAGLFPPDQANVLAHWCANNRKSLELASRELIRGHTTAWLAPVYITNDDGRTEKCLIKYCPAGGRGASEPGAHTEALQSSPKAFARDHLIPQRYEPVAFGDGSCLIFLGIANGGLATVTTTSSLWGTGSLSSALRIIVRSILVDWNPHPRLERTTAAELLHDHFSNRPERDDLYAWIDAFPSLSDVLWLELPDGGDPVPNPLAILDGRLGANLEVRRRVGNAHGDLHLDNILVANAPTWADLRKYRLVDLSTFRADAPLAKDPMFLLTSAILLHLPEMGPRTRWAALRLLIDDATRDGGLVSSELRNCAEAVWQEGHDWAVKDNLADEWKAESLLSVVSAALRHIPWARRAEDRWWFYMLAARASAAWLQMAGDGNARESTDVTELSPLAVAPARMDRSLAVRFYESDAAPDPRGRLTMAELKTFVDKIVSISALHNPRVWSKVVGRLPAELMGSQPPPGDLREQVASLLSRLNRYRHLEPWQKLVAALREEVPNDASSRVIIDDLARTVHKIP
jgi:hypothetical protein